MSRLRGPRNLVGGSILVAALSSACCWLPLVAVGLGSSAAGFGAAFEQFRGPMLALAAGLLVGAVLLERRRQRAACERDGCAQSAGSGLLLPVAGGLFVVALAVVPGLVGWTRPHGEPTTTESSGEFVRTYAVEGMTCEGCTHLLVGYLEDQPEIRRATMDYASATAQVIFVADTSAADTDRVIERVCADWDGKYVFEATPAQPQIVP